MTTIAKLFVVRGLMFEKRVLRGDLSTATKPLTMHEPKAMAG